MTFGQKVPKLNSRPVYCSRLYGRLVATKFLKGTSALLRAGLLKVNRIFRSAPSSHFRCMSNEAFQLYFFGKLSLTFAYLSENPESLIIWKFEKKKIKKKINK